MERTTIMTEIIRYLWRNDVLNNKDVSFKQTTKYHAILIKYALLYVPWVITMRRGSLLCAKGLSIVHDSPNKMLPGKCP